mmetsp:Transcript_19422/g.26658  ORF Transcript_19422/g.26658 Transcript_19422/m.26658 type:complete len:557 (-) Transcript_19422:125-1795(-)|eukprot:CAMPEP_0185736600 /NCGR_PEP_ID=MMETSP1171-20130828/28319_1 /TAXON_ID=374046 /ORGANISM="Helicotheca tamensis, Strain CCMP826" /LENGTH=556 /DNA_ID=CAMNT_0028407271 /DNA_START=166 /DNA_END=1836 /DNA_ORIENTATION=+
MKFHLAILALACITSTGVVDASHVVSGSTSNLPMSLSEIVTDLEAEGVSKVTTAAFLTSKSISPTTRGSLLRSLFGITGSGDHDDEVTDGVTTAFGKKMSDAANEEEEEDRSQIGVGCAIANTSPNAPVSEVASTVLACGGSIVYVAADQDLARGEGLFDTFAPALERLLASRAAAAEAENNESLDRGTSSLIVVVTGAKTQAALDDAKAKFERAASSMLHSIVQPEHGRSASVLGDVFDKVEYVSPQTGTTGLDYLLCGTPGSTCEPSAVSSSISEVWKASILEGKGVHTSSKRLGDCPIDLAAARRLGPAARVALNTAVTTVEQATAASDSGLVTNFGQLCDAATKRCMEQFDAAAGADFVKTSGVAKRIRSDLREEVYAELAELYEDQMNLLHTASFEAFRRGLSKLRVSPNLSSDMEDVCNEQLKLYAAAAKKLGAHGAPSASTWQPSGEAGKAAFKTAMREYCAERLQLARASGQYRPAPRKGFTLGFHWLLPKPFGNDYRLEPWQVHTQNDLVYTPADKITDVSPEDVKTGDWRKSVVPNPTGTEMIYLN